jgi:hypothetical protein
LGACLTGGTCGCVSTGASCDTEEDCCRSPYYNTCMGGACCRVANEVCDTDADCCSGACRGNGVCS